MEKAYIYKIVCKDENIKDFYIGSTYNIKNRIKYHKNKAKNGDTKLYKFIKDFNNFDFIILETFNCENSLEKKQKEQKYINDLKPSLNMINAYSTQDEIKQKNNDYHKKWAKENKNKLKEYHKEYNLINKKSIYDKRNEKISCVCGAITSKRNKSTHLKSKKHINFISD